MENPTQKRKKKKNQSRNRQNQGQRCELVALSALYSLRDSLSREQYEDCPQIIDIALENGATQAQVLYILEDCRRIPA